MRRDRLLLVSRSRTRGAVKEGSRKEHVPGKRDFQSERAVWSRSEYHFSNPRTGIVRGLEKGVGRIRRRG